MTGGSSVRLLSRLGLTLAILSAAISAPAQSPGKVPHIGYLWIGAEGSESRNAAGAPEGLARVRVPRRS
jgi:hypothetical protein